MDLPVPVPYTEVWGIHTLPMSKFATVFRVPCGLLLLGTLLGSVPAQAQFLLSEGDSAPAFSLESLEGKKYSLSSRILPVAKSPRNVVAIFFATFSKPCLDQVAMYKALHRQWKDRGVDFVYVGYREPPEVLKSHFAANPLDIPVLPDRFGRVAMRYGAVVTPHVAIIDTHGKIAFQSQAESLAVGAELEQALAKLTGHALEIPPEVTSAHPKQQVLQFSRAPSSRADATSWTPLLDFISTQQPDIGFKVRVPRSYKEFRAALQLGKYDLVSAGGLQYIHVSDLYEPLSSVVRMGQESYFGIIFVNSKAQVKKLAQLKGRTIAVPSRKSTSGFLFTLLALRDAGLSMSDYKVTFAGSHEEVAKLVLSGKVPAGACFEDCRNLILPDIKEREAKTSILGYTRPIPGDPILVRKSLPEALKRKLRESILAAGKQPELLEAISKDETKITGFKAATDRTYLDIREALREANARH
jgi:phosphonate transport system substrate-binding protein